MGGCESTNNILEKKVMQATLESIWEMKETSGQALKKTISLWKRDR